MHSIIIRLVLSARPPMKLYQPSLHGIITCLHTSVATVNDNRLSPIHILHVLPKAATPATLLRPYSLLHMVQPQIQTWTD